MTASFYTFTALINVIFFPRYSAAQNVGKDFSIGTSSAGTAGGR